MTIKDVARHDVSEQRIAQALEDIWGRAFSRWHTMQYDCYSDEELAGMRDELLDHTAARTVADAEPGTAPSRIVLRTAAECALGLLDLGCYPNGDQEISFTLIDQKLSSEDTDFEAVVEQVATAESWLAAFALSVISGMVWERDLAIGLLLRGDIAPDIHQGVPHSKRESKSDPGELAEMDALCGYLTQAEGHLPRHWPSVTLCKPTAGERADAKRQLDLLDALTPDQRLLRVLVEDDQLAFEQALEERLVQHRESAPFDAAPRSLLPHKTIALAALAVQVHGWDLRVRSAYLPQAMLSAPEGAPSVSG
ncbi:immunity 49 family protein [Streptomyces platensis]|uniref:immunity 49 family protein n=1 Tax=Streptomyces platensis TaxID=58346 RepID=UPI002E140824|nr:immunity 49 family protein [Streptomyces platensis]WTI55956.1 immunity 49 family protein [Streptomyces platensis]WUB78514.1 immunity 49 family protein [Streptomyces platensis]